MYLKGKKISFFSLPLTANLLSLWREIKLIPSQSSKPEICKMLLRCKQRNLQGLPISTNIESAKAASSMSKEICKPANRCKQRTTT